MVGIELLVMTRCLILAPLYPSLASVVLERLGFLNTYAALEGTAIDVVPVQLADGHGGVLVGIHFDKGETPVGLETGLDDETKVLEQRNNVGLGRVGSQITNVAGSLPGRRLIDNHVVAVDAMSREVVVAVRGGWGHAHLLHCLLLGNGRLALLVGPVAADGTGPEPLAIHGAQGLFGIWALTESNEAIATGAAGLHIPHDASFRDGAKGREGLEKNLVVYFIGKITDKDVEMVRSVFFVAVVRLVGPVDSNFLWGRLLARPISLSDCVAVTYRLMDSATVQGLHGTLGGTGVIVLNETIVVALGLNPPNLVNRRTRDRKGIRTTCILVRNDLDTLNMAGGLEDLAQDVLGDPGVQATHIQGTLVRLRSSATTEGGTAAGGHDAALVAAATHRGSDCGRDRVGVLRNMQGRGRHVRRVRASVLAVLVAGRARVGLRRRRELARGRGGTVISHL